MLPTSSPSSPTPFLIPTAPSLRLANHFRRPTLLRVEWRSPLGGATHTPSTLNPQPSTRNPQTSTLNPQPSTLNLNPQPLTLNPQPSTLNPQRSITLSHTTQRGSLAILSGERLHSVGDPEPTHVLPTPRTSRCYRQPIRVLPTSSATHSQQRESSLLTTYWSESTVSSG